MKASGLGCAVWAVLALNMWGCFLAPQATRCEGDGAATCPTGLVCRDGLCAAPGGEGEGEGEGKGEGEGEITLEGAFVPGVVGESEGISLQGTFGVGLIGPPGAISIEGAFQ